MHGCKTLEHAMFSPRKISRTFQNQVQHSITSPVAEPLGLIPMSQKLGERIQKAPQIGSVGIAFWGGYTIDQQKLLG